MVLLRKRFPQNHNLKAAAELGVKNSNFVLVVLASGIFRTFGSCLLSEKVALGKFVIVAFCSSGFCVPNEIVIRSQQV